MSNMLVGSAEGERGRGRGRVHDVVKVSTQINLVRTLEHNVCMYSCIRQWIHFNLLVC